MKVLFVCLGNICRSPAAESVFNHVKKQRPRMKLICDSAGTSGEHDGQRSDVRMLKILQQRGYPEPSCSRKFQQDDFRSFDLIIAMDQSVLRYIEDCAPSNFNRNRLRLMMEFSRNFSVAEVPDPYYGTNKDFEHVVDLLEDACLGLLESIGNREIGGRR